MSTRRLACGSPIAENRSKCRPPKGEAHEDNIALQCLRRNKPLAAGDLLALEQMLIASEAGNEQAIARAKEESLGLGLSIRLLVGLDHQAALEAFADYLDGSRFNANQLHLINLIMGDSTNNGVMEPALLYESPPKEYAARGPESMFSESDVDNIVDTLNTVRSNAQPEEGVT